MDEPGLLIGIVGPCKSGKSELKRGLEDLGFECRQIAQEHSFAPTMWRKIAKPDVLIYLNASYPVTISRSNLNWREKDYQEQMRRLSNARQHADLYLETDDLSIDEVRNKVVQFLKSLG